MTKTGFILQSNIIERIVVIYTILQNYQVSNSSTNHTGNRKSTGIGSKSSSISSFLHIKWVISYLFFVSIHHLIVNMCRFVYMYVCRFVYMYVCIYHQHHLIVDLYISNSWINWVELWFEFLDISNSWIFRILGY